jgi:GH35 family endo-1,4-beta-xylanase
MIYKILLINFFLVFSSYSNDIHDSLDNFVIGATLNLNELNTQKSNLFLKDFTYLTPANAAKQTIIHPKPNIWNWEIGRASCRERVFATV